MERWGGIGRTAFMSSFWCAKEATPSCASCDICSHCSLAPHLVGVRARARARARARLGLGLGLGLGFELGLGIGLGIGFSFNSNPSLTLTRLRSKVASYCGSPTLRTNCAQSVPSVGQPACVVRKSSL